MSSGEKPYYISSVRFTWDPKKAASNVQKHGVSFDEAATVFEDALAVVHPDDAHPERSLIVGTSRRGRLLVCVHIESVEEIRIISARRLTKREKRDYEEGT